jgi:hypothetical protein
MTQEIQLINGKKMTGERRKLSSESFEYVPVKAFREGPTMIRGEPELDKR